MQFSFTTSYFVLTPNDMAHLRRGFKAQDIDLQQTLAKATNFRFCTAPPPSSEANGYTAFSPLGL